MTIYEVPIWPFLGGLILEVLTLAGVTVLASLYQWLSNEPKQRS